MGDTFRYETYSRYSYTFLWNVEFSDTDNSVSPGWLEEYIELGSDDYLIDNAGVADSLLTMAEAAGSALAKDNTQAAVRILDAFIHRVEGQSGHQIDPFMAELLMAEARSVIDSLDE